MLRVGRMALLMAAISSWTVVAQVPQPLPRPGSPAPPPAPPSRPPAAAPAAPKPAPGPNAEAVPTEATLGLPIYPRAQFIASYDAGRGQRYYLFGSDSSFAELVAYYRAALKTKGDLVFEEPATHMFEVGRFREETMAFPPGVTVKDYTWGNLGGYLNPRRGAKPERFPTVIQIVPASADAKP